MDTNEKEAFSDQYIKDQLRLSAIASFEHFCPPELKASDWNHPRLAQYRAQIDRVLGWRPPSKKGLLLAGPSARGKTRAMWQLIKIQAEQGRKVRYWHASQWFSDLQAQVRYGNDDARGWVEYVGKIPLVFIDDLGQQALTTAREDWALGWFFRFLDVRVEHGLPLFVTTNLTGEQMANPGSRRDEIKTDPFVRRLTDLCDVVKFEPQAVEAAA